MSKKHLKLGVDLNEIANNAIQGRIDGLQEENQRLQLEVVKLGSEIDVLKDSLEENHYKQGYLTQLFDKIRKSYSELKPKEETDKEYRKNLNQVRYEYIRDIMVFVFGIKEKYSYVVDGGFCQNLAANFYDNKGYLLFVLNLLAADNSMFNSLNSSIMSFKHPEDFSKEEVLKYVKSPNYNTNGSHNGHYTWIKGWGIPHDFIQSNPHMLDEDVFKEVLESIRLKRGESHLLFQMYKYAEMSDDQIRRMGELTPDIIKPRDNPSEMVTFIKDNLHKFSDETLDILFEKHAGHDNQFKLFHWEKFPVKYQQRYLMNKPIDQVLKVIENYSCKWTVEQKDEFLKQYYEKKTQSTRIPRGPEDIS